MKILCGSDFTAAADAAVEAARAIAARAGGTLRLVHVSDRGDSTAAAAPDAAPAGTPTRPRDLLQPRLEAVAARLAHDGVVPEVAVLRGHSDEAITVDAKRIGADLIVVGALGQRARSQWRLGSTADRIAEHAPCAVLVVRAAEPFSAWARGDRPLRIVVGIDGTPTSEPALRWVARLAASGPCTLVGAHVYWPPEARERLKLSGPIPIGRDHPEVDAAIERDLRERIGAVIGNAKMELRTVGGLGRVADHLVEIAAEERADLIAVGSQQRSGFDRLWHGSISRGVIDAAPENVLCVPSRC